MSKVPQGAFRKKKTFAQVKSDHHFLSRGTKCLENLCKTKLEVVLLLDPRFVVIFWRWLSNRDNAHTSPTKALVEDDFPFSQVEYVSSLEGIYLFVRFAYMFRQ